MSKSKSVWESRFYCLMHRLRMHIDLACQDLASESINANGEKINTVSHWKTIGRHKEIENLIKQAEYIETQMFF